MILGKVLIAFALVGIFLLFFSKLFSRLLNHHFDDIRDLFKRQNHDLDSLIEQEKFRLGAQKESSQNLKEKPLRREGKLGLIIKQGVQAAGYQDALYYIKLQDETQWGQGKLSKEFIANLPKHPPLKSLGRDISLQLKRLLSDDIIFMDGQTKILPKSIFQKKVITYLALLFWLDGKKEEISFPWFESMAKSKKTTLSILRWSFQKQILQLAGKKEQEILKSFYLGKRLVYEGAGAEALAYKAVFHSTRSRFHDYNEIWELALKNINLLEFLAPLPHASQKDKKWASQILRCSPSSSAKEAKKAFKEMAKKKHPDRLKLFGVSDELSELAHKNFLIVNEAYEVFKAG